MLVSGASESHLAVAANPTGGFAGLIREFIAEDVFTARPEKLVWGPEPHSHVNVGCRQEVGPGRSSHKMWEGVRYATRRCRQ